MERDNVIRDIQVPRLMSDQSESRLTRAACMATQLLDSSEPLVVKRAVMVIEQIGPSARIAVPRLIQLLKVRRHLRHVLSALGAIGPAAAEAVPDMCDIMLHGPSLAHEPIYIPSDLAAIGSPAAIDALLQAASTDDRGQGPREGAIEALGEMGHFAASETIEVLMQARGTPDFLYPHATETALAKLAKRCPAEAARANLVAVMPEPLEKCESFDAMVEALEYSSRYTLRTDWIKPTNMLGGLAMALAGACEPSQPPQLLAALRALAELGQDAAPAADTAVASLRDPDPAIRQATCDVLANAMGTTAREVVPLTELARDWRNQTLPVIRAAMRALVWIGNCKSPQVLVETVGQAEFPDKLCGAAAFENFTPPPTEILPHLLNWLTESHWHAHRGPLILAIGNASAPRGPGAQAVLAFLHQPDVRYNALLSLCNMIRHNTPPSPEVAQALVDALDQGDEEDPISDIIYAFRRFSWPPLAPALLKYIRAGKGTNRFIALDVWLDLVADVQDKLPVLRETLTDADEQVRALAAHAAVRVGPSARCLLALIRRQHETGRLPGFDMDEAEARLGN
ncbi:MAG: hypothetical protein ABFD92_08755 [Planctomycetaceae bacterium]|nr:hypothetical protein [Planctomycetaceae bacterium]